MLSAPQGIPEFLVFGALGFGRIHEDAVMLADHLVIAISHRIEEIGIGIADGAIHFKRNDGLRFVDCFDLSGKVGRLKLLLGNVSGVFHHLERPPGHVKDRVIAGLDPDFLAAFAKPLIFGHQMFARGKLFPEILVFVAFGIGRINKDLVMLSFDFRQLVTHRHKEILVGIKDIALKIKFDHGLRLADGINLPGIVGGLQFLCSDITCNLEHLIGLAIAAFDRIIGRLDPDFLATLAEPLKFGGEGFPALQAVPEILVFRTSGELRINKHAVVIATHL